jgi:hypothetical protein
MLSRWMRGVPFLRALLRPPGGGHNSPWRTGDTAPPVNRAGSLDPLVPFLPEEARSLALLAGAGISLDRPSNLLAGCHFMDAVLSRVMPAKVPLDVLQSLISPPKTRHFRPGEFIRFETLMMELVQSGVDPSLLVLDCLDTCEAPNANHEILAELIRRGAVVMTTNFDRLIEVAYQRSMKPGDAPLRVVYDDAEFDEGLIHKGAPSLWKLHGSLSVAGQSTRASVQATVVQVMWPSMSRRKRRFFEAVIAARDMVLVGYSGSDDLDLVPILAETPSERTLLWIDHVPGDAIEIKTALEFVSHHHALTEYEVVGRDRVIFVRRAHGTAKHCEKVAIVTGDTGKILSKLQQHYAPDLVLSAPGPEYEFGIKNPEAVRRYFDRWFKSCSPRPSCRYAFAIDLLTNRRFRTDVRRLREGLQNRYSQLMASATATPEEQLSGLLEEFNSRNHVEEPVGGSRFANEKLFNTAQRLMPLLPEELLGTAQRLSACARWNEKRWQEGERLFRSAWETDRALGQLNQELATLTTWQRATHSLRDHLSEREHQRLNSLAEMLGEPIFPDDAFYRLRELAEETGYKLNVWGHLLQTFDVGYIEEHPSRRQLVRQEARNMLRVAIDMGDVIGEVKARLLLALSLQEAGEFDEATVHVVSLLELKKALDIGEFGLRAQVLLDIMGSKDLAERIRPKIAAAMWA